jgi:hypothetical protein
MTTKHTLLLTIAGIFVSSLSMAQESPKMLADSTKPAVEVKKMNEPKDEKNKDFIFGQ